MPMTPRLAAELRRRGVDPDRLDPRNFLDVGVVTLGEDYVRARDEERAALFELRTLIALLPDPDDDEPDDPRRDTTAEDDLAGWFLPRGGLGHSAEMQRYDRARTLRRRRAPGFADVLRAWTRHHPPTPDDTQV